VVLHQDGHDPHPALWLARVPISMT
jgi:hypothetical protein